MTGRFQNTVLTIAIIVLTIVLIMIGRTLYVNRFSVVFPPVVSDCPDYWLDKSDGDSSNCENVKNLGSCNDKTMDFSSALWKGSEGLCRKQQWAKKCNLTWDGITNNNQLCKTS